MDAVLDTPQSPHLADLHAAFEPVAAGRSTTFTAEDGRALQGRLFEAGRNPSGALLLAGATGVPQRFYSAYATWLAAQGVTTLTFDYRGIGASRDRPLRQDPARMRDWGLLDLPAALDHLQVNAPKLPLYFLGHSVGGQMLGLMPNRQQVEKAVLIASGFGYWRNMPRAYGWMVKALISGLGPLLYRSVGYAPQRRLGWGEDLPRGVAEDWFTWCQRPDYYAELLTVQGKTAFDDLLLPLLSLTFPDDAIATDANVGAQLALYHRAQVTRELVLPSTYGLNGIGHLHFFSSRMPEALWRLPLDWLQSKPEPH
ncbi:alpha/beta hydrolase family protein [Polycyclovorans algicola]|uniref:alpha/beta hydrolase family protein n=1 Tax=Polycyclovorans algicola TaxID=616992 RepID=UPI000694D195|nr:alpha/beta fold hydrolase [Polycyclovorans algicola]